ncbi:MAG: DUF2807 domain-containing protein [Thermodesulfobacteriota bacterium]|nr:DUF2807 domain-containing protein [Thermodesulfobacteriota bacterium]
MKQLTSVGVRMGLLFFGVFVLCASTGFAWQRSSNCIEGNGKTATQQRSLSDYEQIAVQGAYTLTITSGNAYHFLLRGDSNLLKHVVTRVDSGKLRIGNDESLCMKQPLEIEIKVPHLTSFYAEGAHEVTIENIDEPSLDLGLVGASSAMTQGTVKTLKLQISGTSMLDALKMSANSVTVDASGTSLAKIQVAGPLSVTASGICEVLYAGPPTSITADLCGLAEVSPID